MIKTELKSLLTEIFIEKFKQKARSVDDMISDSIVPLKILGYNVKYNILNDFFWRGRNAELDETEFLIFVNINEECFYVQLIKKKVNGEIIESKNYACSYTILVKTDEEIYSLIPI